MKCCQEESMHETMWKGKKNKTEILLQEVKEKLKARRKVDSTNEMYGQTL